MAKLQKSSATFCKISHSKQCQTMVKMYATILVHESKLHTCTVPIHLKVTYSLTFEFDLVLTVSVVLIFQYQDQWSNGDVTTKLPSL